MPLVLTRLSRSCFACDMWLGPSISRQRIVHCAPFGIVALSFARACCPPVALPVNFGAESINTASALDGLFSLHDVAATPTTARATTDTTTGKRMGALHMRGRILPDSAAGHPLPARA